MLKYVLLQKNKSMKFLFTLFSFLTIFNSISQLKTPPLSPKCKIEQQVGLTNFTIEYSRPSVRERKIFGDLIPFDQVWRLGANENTKISFDDNIYFQDTELKAGTYALFASPGEKKWTLYFYSDYSNWGLPQNWDENKVAFKSEIDVEKSSHTEALTIELSSFKNDGASLVISWEESRICLPFSIKTKEKVISQIESLMSGPSGNDYYKASKFYLQEKLDLKQALIWASKACDLRPEAYWIFRNKALIMAELGDYKSAIEIAKISMELAEKEGDGSYVIQNKNSIEEWKKLKNK